MYILVFLISLFFQILLRAVSIPVNSIRSYSLINSDRVMDKC